MASYTRRIRHIERVEYVIPTYGDENGAPWAEVMKAIRAIHNELFDADPKRYPRGVDLPDNTIMISGDDEAILVTYQTEQLGDTHPGWEA